jgi:hypothetical protein
MMTVATSRRCDFRSGHTSRITTIADTQAARVTPRTMTVEPRFPPKSVDHHAIEAITATAIRPHAIGTSPNLTFRDGASSGAGASRSDDSTGGTESASHPERPIAQISPTGCP